MSKKSFNAAAHFDEDSQRVLTDHDRPDECFLADWCQDFAVNQQTALLMMAKMANHLGETESGMGGRAAARMAIEKLKDLITRGFTQVQLYESHNGDRVMAERCLWLMMDFPALAGADTYEALVKLLAPRKKQTVNKCMQFLQSQIPELPILQGQRDEAARENISTATKNGWRKKCNEKAHL